MAGSKHRRFWEIIIPGLIVAFALSAMVYVGSALLQTINFVHPAEPGAALESAALGFLLGIAGGLVVRRNRERD
jgi:carbohydrate-binding DOMON domain-containing protein